MVSCTFEYFDLTGDGKRGGTSASVLAPILDSTHNRMVMYENPVFLPLMLLREANGR
jgi:hypothetical protein